MATGPRESSPNPHSIFSLQLFQYWPLFQDQVSNAVCIISDSSIKMSREFLFSPAYSTCPAHISLLEWTTLISCGEGSKPRRFLLRAFIQRPLIVSLLDQIFCSTPFFSNVFNFRRVRKTAKKRLLALSCFVCPRGTTLLPLDVFSLNLIYE